MFQLLLLLGMFVATNTRVMQQQLLLLGMHYTPINVLCSSCCYFLVSHSHQIMCNVLVVAMFQPNHVRIEFVNSEYTRMENERKSKNAFLLLSFLFHSFLFACVCLQTRKTVGKWNRVGSHLPEEKLSIDTQLKVGEAFSQK